MNNHKKFLERQKRYELIYQKQFYKWLQGVNYSYARIIQKDGFIPLVDVNEDKLTEIYVKLYNRVTINEAKYTYKHFPNNKKDLIDDLINIIRSGENETGLIKLWRSLLGEFMQVRIANRITEVSNTTKNRVAKIIEKGIQQGLGASDVAKLIRNDRKFNYNRSVAIARTETVTAANQGAFMAANSNKYVMEKKWVPTNDARTRLPHRQMANTPYIDMDLPFNVVNNKGQLEAGLYPCADSFGASNTVNCRCGLIFRPKKDINGRLILK